MRQNEMYEIKKNKVWELIKHEEYKPLKIKEIMMVMGIQNDERSLLEQILIELIHEGKILKTKRGKFALPETIGFLVGTFEGHQNGFGFAVMDNQLEDIFIPKASVNGAMHKDKVLFRITKEKNENRRSEGEIVEILERGFYEVVGTFDRSQSFGFVIADDSKIAQDIFISKKNINGAKTGQKVVCKITRYPEEDKKPEGKITEILGDMNEPTVEILAIVRQFDIPVDFPKSVLKQVEEIPDQVPEKDKGGRVDLRDVQMVTIDGEDAKDLDDAVSLRKIDDNLYELGVHIADVTHYVKDGTALDSEALKRGTSVYLVDRVIPMLPKKLSNGLCSLNANVDRLALSCIMEIDGEGRVVDHKIQETLINVDRRMTYTNVKKILEDEDEGLREEYKDFVPMFEEMKKLSLILRKKRFGRGSIDFNFEETKIVLDAKGNPVGIKPYDRNIATRLIEEFMLITNETVAEDYFWQGIPFLYRSHEEPDQERIQKLSEFIHNFGFAIKGNHGEVHPKALQQVLEDIEGSKEEGIISRLVLRSMKQAKYTHTSEGHFGLAAQYYSHFTSPIRRYPDLQIHRIIKENIHSKLSEKRLNILNEKMPEVAKSCSTNERRAVDAERETEKFMKAKYMSDKVGEKFDGVISSITNWGIYVELPNTIEGLVHVTNLKDDYYVFDDKLQVFVGERTKNVYKLGEQVRVELIGVDMIRRTIDFIIDSKIEQIEEE